MISCCEIIYRHIKSEGEYYFAGSNSAAGFVGKYDELLNDTVPERVFIIKGGPGTGKSTLMRVAAEKSKMAGADVEYIYCASDPSSLDGVIIKSPDKSLTDPPPDKLCNDRKYYGSVVAIMDGTAPHTRDCEIPGGRDEIIDLGAFWNARQLYYRRAEIQELGARKKAYFANAYKFLSAAQSLDDFVTEEQLRAADTEKIKKAAERFTEKFSKTADKGECIVRLISAISMNGTVRFDTLEKKAKKIYRIVGGASGRFYLDEIIQASKRKGIRLIIAPSPINHNIIEAVYITGADILLETLDCDEEFLDKSRGANIGRFADEEKIKRNKHQIKRSKKMYDMCIKEACECLEQAKIAHFEIERIYADSMDYKGVGDLSNTIAERIVELL